MCCLSVSFIVLLFLYWESICGIEDKDQSLIYVLYTIHLITLYTSAVSLLSSTKNLSPYNLSMTLIISIARLNLHLLLLYLSADMMTRTEQIYLSQFTNSKFRTNSSRVLFAFYFFSAVESTTKSPHFP